MKNKIKTSVLLLVICFLFLAACFGGRQGDEASIVLNLGGSTGNRTVWFHDKNPDILNEIVYTVKISGQDNKELESTGGTTIIATVTPGIYNIDIEARYLDSPYAKGSVENITIKAGQNNVPVQLKEWLDPDKTYLIAEAQGIKKEFDSFEEAFNEATSQLELEDFTISISDGDHFIEGDGGCCYIDTSVTIKNHGNGAYLKHKMPNDEESLSGPLFSVRGKLTLQGNITLQGISNNKSALIVVSEYGEGGTLTLDGNVTITGNKNNLKRAWFLTEYSPAFGRQKLIMQ